MTYQERIIERANQILDLPVRAEDKCFNRLSEQESDSFVRAVREKVSVGRGAANFNSVPGWRMRWVDERKA